MRVTASRLRRMRFDAVDDIFFRFDGSRPIGASMRRPAITSPQTSAMYSFSTSRVAKLARQLFVRRVVLGDHHQPRRAAVETMHDPGPLLAADAAEIVDVVQQRVDQRAARMARRRMDDHPRGLVDHDEVVVLVEDRQRQRFGLRRRRRPAPGRRGRSPGRSSPAGSPSPRGPATRTWPSLISRWICDRDCAGISDTRNRSRRRPSLSSGR